MSFAGVLGKREHESLCYGDQSGFIADFFGSSLRSIRKRHKVSLYSGHEMVHGEAFFGPTSPRSPLDCTRRTLLPSPCGAPPPETNAFCGSSFVFCTPPQGQKLPQDLGAFRFLNDGHDDVRHQDVHRMSISVPREGNMLRCTSQPPGPGFPAQDSSCFGAPRSLSMFQPPFPHVAAPSQAVVPAQGGSGRCSPLPGVFIPGPEVQAGKSSALRLEEHSDAEDCSTVVRRLLQSADSGGCTRGSPRGLTPVQGECGSRGREGGEGVQHGSSHLTKHPRGSVLRALGRHDSLGTQDSWSLPDPTPSTTASSPKSGADLPGWRPSLLGRRMVDSRVPQVQCTWTEDPAMKCALATEAEETKKADVGTIVGAAAALGRSTGRRLSINGAKELEEVRRCLFFGAEDTAAVSPSGALSASPGPSRLSAKASSGTLQRAMADLMVKFSWSCHLSSLEKPGHVAPPFSFASIGGQSSSSPVVTLWEAGVGSGVRECGSKKTKKGKKGTGEERKKKKKKSTNSSGGSGQGEDGGEGDGGLGDDGEEDGEDNQRKGNLEERDEEDEEERGEEEEQEAGPGEGTEAQQDEGGNGDRARRTEYEPKRVYVGGLPYTYTDEDIRFIFQDCGEVEDIDCMTFPDSGRFRGIAFVSFKSARSAKKALEKDGEQWETRYLRVQRCKVKRAADTQNSERDQGKRKDRAPPEKTEGYLRAFIGNLNWTISEEDIRAFFKGCQIKAVRIATDKETGRPKGFGHVDFEDDASLELAVSRDQGVALGRPMKVAYAVGKTLQRSQTEDNAEEPPRKRSQIARDGDQGTWHGQGRAADGMDVGMQVKKRHRKV